MYKILDEQAKIIVSNQSSVLACDQGLFLTQSYFFHSTIKVALRLVALQQEMKLLRESYADKNN